EAVYIGVGPGAHGRVQRGGSNLAILLRRSPAASVAYTLSLHDALPISVPEADVPVDAGLGGGVADVAQNRRPVRDTAAEAGIDRDRKSTRLNSSHVARSYAVFCLKKKFLGTHSI